MWFPSEKWNCKYYLQIIQIYLPKCVGEIWWNRNSHRNWQRSTSALLSRDRESLFSHENPIFSCQKRFLPSNSAVQEETQITHSNISPQWKLVLGINDGEVDRNRKQNMNLETFWSQHFSIISCVTKKSRHTEKALCHWVKYFPNKR